MKNLFNLLFLVLVMALISCSSKSNQKEENKVESMMDDSVALEDEFEDEKAFEEDSFTQDTIEERKEDIVAENDFENRKVETQQDFAASSEVESSVSPTDQVAQYTIQKGDTLMLISFKIYGDYGRWRELAQSNPQLASFQSLNSGEVLNYQVPNEQFNWRPEGDSYLIKRNDTLGTISQDLFNTTSKWKNLYEHNKPLIKNPNMIFAGFTIYYMQWNEDGRDLANQ